MAQCSSTGADSKKGTVMKLKTTCKMAVLHVNKCSVSGVSVTGRLGLFVSDTLGIPFIHDVQSSLQWLDDYDVLWVLHGHMPFSDHRRFCMELNKRAREVVWIQNDHAFAVDKRMDHPKHRWWTTVEKCARPGSNDAWINWNRLTWVPDVWKDTYSVPGLMYYGAYRPDRLDDFNKYMLDAPYPVNVIGYPKNTKLFQALDTRIKAFQAFKDQRQLRVFQAALYIQDRHNDTYYGCPANRFYEMLYTGIPMIFDSKCVGTFERACVTEGVDFDIRPYMVRSAIEVPALLRRSVVIGEEQRAAWYKDYKAMLTNDFIELCRKANFIQ